MTRIRSIFAVTLMLAGCGAGGDDRTALPPATGPSSPPLPALPALVRPAQPPSSAIASADRATGTLVPHAEVAVVARATGVLVELGVEVGARVTRGQVVFRVDDRGAVLRLAQARTQLAVAAVQLRTAQVEYRRAKGLFDQQAVSQQQWDQVSAQLDAARAGVAQARSSVAVAGNAVSEATARAPIAGIVVSLPVAVGDFVNAAAATRVVIVQDQTTLDVRFRLPEQALLHVRPGDAVAIALPGLAAARTAQVAIVAPSVDPRTRTVELTAVLDNRDGALRPGLMAEVSLGAARISQSSQSSQASGPRTAP
ncbi:MAG TPA: efflux RND transporter periplasmic adaptor subunit [Kofleriaceae bacterium]|jgi:RND family efflux transporter MFP subunit|nr:efflux RND transporter periplasmic adaptor subunit [Kofleriaceae bacterium]